jgi:hypothetical protein
MANTNAPFGFQLAGFLDGRSGSLGQQTRLIANADTNAVYSGDPVTSLSTGYVTRSTAGTTQIAGIFIGCTYLNTALGRTVWSPSWPGSGATGDVTAYVVTDPQAVFKVQAGGSSTAIGLADINTNVNFALGTPNTTSGQSGAYADQTTLSASTTTLPFRVVGLVQAPPGANGTDITSGYNQILVAFNFQDFRVTTGT